MSNLDKPAMPTEHIPGGWRNQGDLSEGITIRQHAALTLRVPMSGDPELDAMIREARRLDMATAAMQSFLHVEAPADEGEGYSATNTLTKAALHVADDLLAASEPKKAEPEHKHEIVPMFGCDAEGWIEWNGGECPVAPDQVVRARLRNGGEHVGAAGYFLWAHLDDDDIIAYRVVK